MAETIDAFMQRVEAKTPGIQAAFMKTYRQMAFGATVSLPLPIGALDNGAVFSPTQAIQRLTCQVDGLRSRIVDEVRGPPLRQ